MPRRGRNYRYDKNYNDKHLEVIIAGMRDEWMGRTGADVTNMISRLQGVEGASNIQYANRAGYQKGCQIAKFIRALAQDGRVLPNNEAALGRLILGEQATMMDHITEMGENAYNWTTGGSDDGGMLNGLLQEFGMA